MHKLHTIVGTSLFHVADILSLSSSSPCKIPRRTQDAYLKRRDMLRSFLTDENIDRLIADWLKKVSIKYRPVPYRYTHVYKPNYLITRRTGNLNLSMFYLPVNIKFSLVHIHTVHT